MKKKYDIDMTRTTVSSTQLVLELDIPAGASLKKIETLVLETALKIDTDWFEVGSDITDFTIDEVTPE